MTPTDSRRLPKVARAILEFKDAVPNVYSVFPFLIFCIVADNPGIYLTEVSVLLGLGARTGKVSNDLDVLKDKHGLVAVEQADDDERIKCLKLTPKGQRIAERIKPFI